MTNWRAVGVGLTIELFIGFVGILVPGIGQLIAGLIGGLVAGYMASTTIRGGLWHGLLAGSLGGFLIAIPFGLIIGVASFGIGITNQLGSFVAGLGTVIFTLIAAVILGANSALGGAMGAILKDKYPDIARRDIRIIRSEPEKRTVTRRTNNQQIRERDQESLPEDRKVIDHDTNEN